MFGIRERILGTAETDPPDTVIYRMPWWCAALPCVPWLITGAVVSLILVQRAPSAAVVPWNTLVVYFLAPALLLVLIGRKLSRMEMIVANSEGIVWWPIGRVRWTEIRGAELRRLLGLRYVVVTRERGRPHTLWWSLPGARDFALRLLPVAPDRNALKECIESERRRSVAPLA